jgi:hypothetical protein
MGFPLSERPYRCRGEYSKEDANGEDAESGNASDVSNRVLYHFGFFLLTVALPLARLDCWTLPPWGRVWP